MTYAKPMLDAHPGELKLDGDVLVRCIEACYDCSQACTACADDCLGEESLAEFVKCIRLCDDCADICLAAGRATTRQTEYDADVRRTIVDACAEACSASGDECARHAPHHEHCRICAEACRRCEEACRELLAAIG